MRTAKAATERKRVVTPREQETTPKNKEPVANNRQAPPYRVLALGALRDLLYNAEDLLRQLALDNKGYRRMRVSNKRGRA